ncbi:MAG: hydroxymethylglutaryl-CoA reductase, degradative [Anaerolineaceae bacterium]|nr:hydroxymethylglutaryl-CoA reductase, degradative [Anaerolineaceae bacterium]
MTENSKKFYQLEVSERKAALIEMGVEPSTAEALCTARGLSLEQANQMIENVVGVYGLPLGIAQHFMVNGRDVLVPMVVEEPSVVAAASFMAKLARAGGGFQASTTPPEMIGQVQLLDIEDVEKAAEKIRAEKARLLEAASVDPVLMKLGGGPREIEARVIHESPIGPFVVVHLIYDVRDAMGANAMNTAVEKLSPILEQISGGRAHLRILSNLADRRLAKVRCRIPLESLAFGDYSAEQVRDGILEAWAFAAADPYRAATHNKGIMNGIDALVIATGNDWRAVEAGAHAYAARNGRYTSLSRWCKAENGDLIGELEMPMAIGTVGGATRVHPMARAALQLMGVSGAEELAQVAVSLGLAQNLAAIRALATEGIQRGHMNLHARQVAIAAGATAEQVPLLSARLVSEKTVRIDRAKEILEEWKGEEGKA